MDQHSIRLMGDIQNGIEELVEAARFSDPFPDASSHYRDTHAALLESIRAYAAQAWAGERERCAQAADDWGVGATSGITPIAFEAKYGAHASLAAAIRALPETSP